MPVYLSHNREMPDWYLSSSTRWFQFTQIVGVIDNLAVTLDPYSAQLYFTIHPVDIESCLRDGSDRQPNIRLENRTDFRDFVTFYNETLVPGRCVHSSSTTVPHPEILKSLTGRAATLPLETHRSKWWNGMLDWTVDIFA